MADEGNVEVERDDPVTDNTAPSTVGAWPCPKIGNDDSEGVVCVGAKEDARSKELLLLSLELPVLLLLLTL